MAYCCPLPDGNGISHGNPLLDGKSLRNSFTWAKCCHWQPHSNHPQVNGLWIPIPLFHLMAFLPGQGPDVTAQWHISRHCWSRFCFGNDLFHKAFKHGLQFHWNPRTAGREMNASFWLQITSVCSSEVSWNSSKQNQILLLSFSFYCDIKGRVRCSDQSGTVTGVWERGYVIIQVPCTKTWGQKWEAHTYAKRVWGFENRDISVHKHIFLFTSTRLLSEKLVLWCWNCKVGYQSMALLLKCSIKKWRIKYIKPG